MDSNEESNRQLAEFLWIEINKAVLKSPEVRSSIKRLESLNLLQFISKYDLVLDVKKLIELVHGEGQEKTESLPGEQPQQRFYPDTFRNNEDTTDFLGKDATEFPEVKNTLRQLKKKLEENEQKIDGRVMSPNEIQYQEYLEKVFNEEEWLKKAGILWEA